jgi:hypothetical protein
MVALAGLALVADQPPQTPATGLVAGQVIDATTRRPLGGAVVTLAAATEAQPASEGTTVRQRATVVANGQGQFVFRDVPAGSYSLTSTGDNYAPGALGRRRPGWPSQPLVLAAGERATGVVIGMWRLASISGVVRDDRGEPVIGVHPTARRRTLKGGRFEIGFSGGSGSTTDDRGQFRIHDLMPGSYVVAVRNSIQSAAVSSLEALRAAATSGTAGAITREWPYSGVVRSSWDQSGVILGGWQATVGSGDVPPRPGPDGTLLVHPNVYFPNAQNVSQATIVELGAGDDRTGVDFTLPLVRGVRVSGTLSSPAGPAPNQGLRLVPASIGDTVFDAPVAYATSDSAGRFAFLGVAPGSYAIEAYRIMPSGPTYAFTPAAAGARGGERMETIPPPSPPFPSTFAEVPVTVGSEHVEGIEVGLRPGVRVTGRAEFDGANPPTDAERQRVAIRLQPLNGALPVATIQPPAGARLDASGAFQCSEHPPGRYHVEVASPGPAWSVASIRLGGADVAGQAFTLADRDIDDVVVTFTTRKITLSGSVKTPDGSRDAESTVLVVPANLDSWIATGMSPRRTATAYVPATGTYQLQIPLPGDYVVAALPPEVEVSMEPDFLKRIVAQGVRVSVAPGETKTQPLTIGRAR